jgi:hypothetical protein
MNWLNTLPDDILEKIYFINHQSYQREINRNLSKPQFQTWNLARKNLKIFIYHLENTFQ